MAESTSSASASSAPKGQATVRFGFQHQTGDFTDMTVKQLRERFSSMWGLPSDAIAYKGKTRLEDSFVVSSDDEISFIKRSGEKGSGE